MTGSAFFERRDPGAVLALGFGTTVAMWAAGYLLRLPWIQAPSALVALAMLGLLAGGGFLAGRFAGGWRTGALAGLLTMALNVLILGSLLTSSDAPNRLRPGAAIWLPGALLAGAAIGALAALAGSSGRGPGRVPPNWIGIFAGVAAAATLGLVTIGGLVTSNDAGLAVVDWPNSFGYNMFLYPLSRMTGGIYYEHAHRLFGSLVGLTTLVLAIVLGRTDDRKWVRRLALLAFALVVAQGVLGGLRVTGRFTLSADPARTAPSLVLAVVHGVTGQLFFALMVALAVVTTRRFREDCAGRDRPRGGDRARTHGAAGRRADRAARPRRGPAPHRDRAARAHFDGDARRRPRGRDGRARVGPLRADRHDAPDGEGAARAGGRPAHARCRRAGGGHDAAPGDARAAVGGDRHHLAPGDGCAAARGRGCAGDLVAGG